MRTAEARGSTLSWRGRLAALLLGFAAVQLFLPAIPPTWKGSVWAWLSAYLGVLFAALEVRRTAPRIRAAWGGLRPTPRVAAAAALVAAVAGGCLLLRELAPHVFDRAQREEGLIEPLSLLAYLAAGLLLRSARTGERPMARHLSLLAGGFFLLGLEEVDYFGLFGSLIGRVHGQYVGSLHDVIGLMAAGALPPAASVGLAAGSVLAAFALWRGGWLQPRLLAASLRPPAGAAAGVGLLLLALAALVEAEVLGAVRRPSPEEAIELAGALCLALFALETAARRQRGGETGRGGVARRGVDPYGSAT